MKGLTENETAAKYARFLIPYTLYNSSSSLYRYLQHTSKLQMTVTFRGSGIIGKKLVFKKWRNCPLSWCLRNLFSTGRFWKFSPAMLLLAKSFCNNSKKWKFIRMKYEYFFVYSIHKFILFQMNPNSNWPVNR